MASSVSTQEGKSTELEHIDYASYLVVSGVFSKVLHAAIQLDLLEIMAKAGQGAFMPPSEIAAHLPDCTNPGAPAMLDAILYLLATHAIVTATIDPPAAAGNGEIAMGNRVYGLAPASKYFIRNQRGASFGPWLALAQGKPGPHDRWNKLKDLVLKGRTAEHVNPFESERRDTWSHQVFNAAMYNHTDVFMEELLDSYEGLFDYLRFKRLVDVGGGLGNALRMITARYPTIKGINFDLPSVVENAPPCPGVEHVGGDMFENIPEGEAIFMKWILHDWNDESCVTLLKNCARSLPNNGTVIVLEPLLPQIPDTSYATKFVSHLNMIMMKNLEGRERTKEEYLALAKAAGFSGINFESSPNSFCVMKFFKKQL